MSVPVTAINDDDGRCRVVVKEHDLLCQNRCGFYGNPQWGGFCSQCQRQRASQTLSKSEDTFNKNRSLLTKEERRLPSVDPKNLVRSVIRKSPSILSSPLNAVSEPSPVEFHFTRSSSPDSLDADSQLHKYISKNFSHSHAKELERICDAVIEKLYKKKQSSMDDLSLIIQDFYTAISDRASKFGPTGSKFTSSEFLEHVENFVCVRAYGLLFCSRSDEEAVDLSLQDHIRKLHWVTHGFLETALDFESKKVEDLLNDSMAEISEMNSHKKITEKFDCLLRCSEKLFQAIRESTNAPASADEFLPSLIYIILKCNPTLIQSNINFIQRFSLNSRTCRGETGYQFTNLCCAVCFIQEMSADSLRMSKEEFEAYNLGKQPALNRIRSHVSATKSLENSLQKIEKLNENAEQLKNSINEVSNSIEKNFSSLNAELNRILEAPDLVLPPELDATKLVNFDKTQLAQSANEEDKIESTSQQNEVEETKPQETDIQ